MTPLRRGQRHVARDSEAQVVIDDNDEDNDGDDSDCLDRFGYSAGKRRQQVAHSRSAAESGGGGTILTWRVVAMVVAFRICKALFLATYFNPDEFWQGLEVAHDMAFGCGAQPPTWEWGPDARIRGYLHPLVLAGVFRVLAVLGLDSRTAVIGAPKILQGVLAAVCDLCVASLVEHRNRIGSGSGGGGDGEREGGDRASASARARSAGAWALACSLSSWFLFYCLPRTFSNSLETVLTTLGLWFLYGPPQQRARGGSSASSGGSSTSSRSARDADRRPGRRVLPVGLGGTRRAAAAAAAAASLLPWGAVLCAGLAVAVRPTAAVVWVGIALGLVLHEEGWASPARLAACVLQRVLPAAAAVLAVSAVVDRWFYGAWTLPPWNFVRLNVGHGINELCALLRCSTCRRPAPPQPPAPPTPEPSPTSFCFCFSNYYSHEIIV